MDITKYRTYHQKDTRKVYHKYDGKYRKLSGGQHVQSHILQNIIKLYERIGYLAH